MLSSTVTVALQVADAPSTFWTVSVTVFAPTLAQVNVAGETDIEAIPQGSLLPLSICEAKIVALPLAFNSTVMF